MKIKNHYFLLVICFFLATLSQAQDKITKLDGKEFKCKITSVDSIRIYLNHNFKGVQRSSSIKLSETSSYTLNGKTTYLNVPENLSKNALSQSSIDYNPLKLYADSVEKKHEYFIVNVSNEIIAGRNIEYLKPFLGSATIQIDSRNMAPYVVKFYKNEEGFFANTQDVSINGNSEFCQRVKKGKINLYETVKTTQSMGSYHTVPGAYGTVGFGPSGGGMYVGGFSTTHIKNYYNIGFSSLKKADYNNLSLDLASNPESMIHLEKYKSVKKSQTILYIVGGVTLIGGVATLINKTKDWDGTDATQEPNVTANIVSIGIGAGCFWASYFISFSKPKHLRNAIEAYNH